MGEDVSMFVILVLDYFSSIVALILMFWVNLFIDFGKKTKTDRMSESKSTFKLFQLFLSTMWTNLLLCAYISWNPQTVQTPVTWITMYIDYVINAGMLLMLIYILVNTFITRKTKNID